MCIFVESARTKEDIESVETTFSSNIFSIKINYVKKTYFREN